MPAALNAFTAEDKARLVIAVSVHDGEDREVMRAVAHWHLRSRATMRGD